MATVSGLTATRMQEIADATIIGGHITSGHLILEKQDASTIDLGDIGGVPGPPGGLDDTSSHLVSPSGMIAAFGGSAAPTGWLLCNGASVLRADYPALFTAIGVAYGSVDGTHFNVPDLRQSFPIGKAASGVASTLGDSGGSKDLIVVSHSHSHRHTIGEDGAHVHGVDGDTGNRIWITAAGSQANSIPLTTGNTVPSNLDSAGTHDHGGFTGTTATNTGSSGTDQNLPPYAVVNYIIRY